MVKAAEIFSTDLLTCTPAELFPAISRCYNIDEADWLEQLLTALDVSAEQEHFIAERATALISAVRDSDQGLHIVDALLLQYSLNTQEGVLLMCLAEALMRIPDSATADALIRDKLTVADWKKHLHQSNSLLVNASTWGLMFTGKVLRLDQSDGSASGVIDRLVNKMGEPLIRTAIHQAMTIMAKHFVLGHTIKDALNNGKKALAQGYCYSFDMLGEAALTTDDARRYWQNYRYAIETLGQQTGRWQGRATLSIKLSALHPRYEAHQEHRVLTELYHDVLDLITTARARCRDHDRRRRSRPPGIIAQAI